MPVSKKRKKKKSKAQKHVFGRKPQKKTPNYNQKLAAKLKSREGFENIEVEQNLSKVKVSEVFLAYASDHIERCSSESEYRKFVPFLVMCWNLGNIKEEEQREKEIQTFIRKMGMQEIEEDIRILVDRKLRYYSEDRYHIVDYEITMLNKVDMHLSVATLAF